MIQLLRMLWGVSDGLDQIMAENEEERAISNEKWNTLLVSLVRRTRTTTTTTGGGRS